MTAYNYLSILVCLHTICVTNDPQASCRHSSDKRLSFEFLTLYVNK